MMSVRMRRVLMARLAPGPQAITTALRGKGRLALRYSKKKGRILRMRP
jgi:hypothetical protein